MIAKNLARVALLGYFAAGIVSAQQVTVTVTRPNEAPITLTCPAGCDVTASFPPPVVTPPPPPPCTWTVAPTTLTFPAAGGVQGVSVTASRDDCPWGTSGSLSWLTLDPGDAQSALWVTAAANTGTTPRTATVTIAGQAVTVTQDAAPLPPPPPPTGTVLARLNCTQANFPHCGIGYWGRKPEPLPANYPVEAYNGHTVTQVGNGARFRLTPGTTQAQFYLGWQFPTQNTTAGSIYLRFHLTINAPFNATGVGDVWTDKLAIVNNGGSTRAIGELRPVRSNTDVTIGIQKNIDGGVTLTPRQDLAIGRRYAVQMRISRGSAVRFATCLDQPLESACVQSGTFSFAIPSFQNVGLGFYSNATVAAGGSVDFTIENAEVGTAFDPNFR